MTKPNSIFLKHGVATEDSIHSFSVDASQLRIPPGTLPTEIPTELGNGQPFIFLRWDRTHPEEPTAVYRQYLGCIELTVWND